MKTIYQAWKSAARIGFAVAVGSLLCAPMSILAQDPKGAEKLMQLKPVNTVEALHTVDAGDTIVMTCPKCTSTNKTVVVKSFKGANANELKNVTIHLCPTCETKLVTQGQGKSAKEVLVHTCTTCGSTNVSCCVMKKKNASPTPGMGDKK